MVEAEAVAEVEEDGVGAGVVMETTKVLFLESHFRIAEKY